MATNKLIFILFISLLFINGVYASDFTIVSVTKQSSVTPYRVDSVNYTGVIRANSDNFCNLINCQFNVGSDSGFVSDNGESRSGELSAGNSQEFPFTILAEGSSPVSVLLTVSCETKTFCAGGSPSQQKAISLFFLYPGDGICTTPKEKCSDYSSYLGTSDCSCLPTKECRPNGNRNPDSNGCQNYCGNGICEKSEGESCSSCQNDCKKCDGLSCIAGSECEGKYCVHNICNHLAYIADDTYCDKNVGESCKNSGSDCVCGSNERCSSSGVCETYCGNGICEASERGVCKVDCTWCGDGTCQSDESCSSCSDDCGICKKPTKEEELQRNIDAGSNTQINNLQKTQTQSVAGSNYGLSLLSSLKQNKKSIVGGTTILALILLIVAIVYYFVHKKKKSLGGHRKEIARCQKCKAKIEVDQKFCHKCGHVVSSKKDTSKKEKQKDKKG